MWNEARDGTGGEREGETGGMAKPQPQPRVGPRTRSVVLQGLVQLGCRRASSLTKGLSCWTAAWPSSTVEGSSMDGVVEVASPAVAVQAIAAAAGDGLEFGAVSPAGPATMQEE